MSGHNNRPHSSNHRTTHWLRWLLLCTAFSALHSVLGAWVVPVVASGPVAEVCTPQGMQWVRVDAASAVSAEVNGPTGSPEPWPQGLAKPCAWAAATVCVPPEPCPMRGALQPIGPHRLPAGCGLGIVPADTMERVLLMAAMRAPPAGCSPWVG